MTTTKTCCAVFVAVALVALPARAAVITHVDDDFEAYTGTSGGANPLDGQWTILTNIVDSVGHTAVLQTSGGGEGGSSNYVQFTGNGNAAGDKGGIEQTLSLEPGAPHTLSFFYNGIGSGNEITVTVTNSDILPTVFNPVAGVWTEGTLTFFPTSSSVTLRFQETQVNSASRAPQLDSVLLTSIFVPEPTSALLVAPLMFLVFRKRRTLRRG